MKKIYFLVIALMLSISTMQAGLPPEFSEANADGVMISYGYASSWFANYEGNDLMVTWWENDEKYSGEVVIPETVVHGGITHSVIGIASWAFSNYYCTDLQSVSIPESVYYIDTDAFDGNSTLTDIYVEWRDPATVRVEPSANFNGLTTSNITLHVPAGLKTLYETFDVWKNFNIVDDGKDVTGMARLSSLAVSAGVLSPTFRQSQYSYTVTVPQSVANITLTATPAYGGTVSGNGQKSLNIGENDFSLSVTSADGKQQITYTVKVIRLEVDIVLELISAANETGNYYFTDYGGNRLYIPDRRNLTYRLLTGNTSGNVPLHFAAGGKTLEREVILQANHIYEMDVRVWISKDDMSCITHFDVFGRPSYSEIEYSNRTTATVTISNNGQTLISSETALLGPPESIEFRSIEAKGTTSIAEVSVETARPVGYYSITGQKLNREPDSGIYIIQYDNGKAKKVLRRR
jgi:hypothetical protein